MPNFKTRSVYMDEPLGLRLLPVLKQDFRQPGVKNDILNFRKNRISGTMCLL